MGVKAPILSWEGSHEIDYSHLCPRWEAESLNFVDENNELTNCSLVYSFSTALKQQSPLRSVSLMTIKVKSIHFLSYNEFWIWVNQLQMYHLVGFIEWINPMNLNEWNESIVLYFGWYSQVFDGRRKREFWLINHTPQSVELIIYLLSLF